MDKISKIELKNGIKLHIINTNKFKINLVAVFLTSELSRETITKKALILSILKRGNNEIKTQEELNRKLEELYGAECDCGIDKNGDNHVSKFYIESLNNSYALNKENLLKESVDVLFNIIFNPIIENGKFKEEYFLGEKENLKQIIESRKDNKRTYATIRCIEEMYKDRPYGLYKYGYIEDLEKITNEELYKEYRRIIEESKIDIFVSGNVYEEQVKDIIAENKFIKSLKERQYQITVDKEGKEENKEKCIIETTNATQGNLNIGIKLSNNTKENQVKASVYNAILGGGANSKLFQNVREKEGLAYSAGSIYIKTKNTIIIKCGIEPENYDKTLKIVKEQLEDMKKGKFSQEDMDKAKNLIIASFRAMQDEQDSEVSYYFGQELNNNVAEVEDHINKVKMVTKEDILEIANNLNISTIYFLTKEDNANE